MPGTTFEKGDVVRVSSAGLRRLTASEQKRLGDRRGVVQSAFTPQGRTAEVVNVQWLAKNNVHTFGQPESWAASLLERAVSPEHEERP